MTKDDLIAKQKEFIDFLSKYFSWDYFEPSLEAKNIYTQFSEEISTLKAELNQEPEIPKIVCICGSGRFLKQMHEVEERLTLDGKIVLMIGVNTKDVARTVELSKHKPMLDELHLRKIDLSDEVLVVAVNNYIGESTKREIKYATSLGKKIEYYTPTIAQEPEGVTAEEILKRIGYDNDSITTTEKWIAKEVYKLAMEQYTRAKQPELREELINFREHYNKQLLVNDTGHISEQDIDDYLISKNRNK